MLVKLKVLSASPSGVFRPGSVADLPETVAMGLVEGGYAEIVDEAKKQMPKKKEVETSESKKTTKRKKATRR